MKALRACWIGGVVLLLGGCATSPFDLIPAKDRALIEGDARQPSAGPTTVDAMLRRVRGEKTNEPKAIELRYHPGLDQLGESERKLASDFIAAHRSAAYEAVIGPGRQKGWTDVALGSRRAAQARSIFPEARFRYDPEAPADTLRLVAAAK